LNEPKYILLDEWIEFEDQYYAEAKRQIRNSLGTFGSKKNSVDYVNENKRVIISQGSMPIPIN
jgi:hypothetical protein